MILCVGCGQKEEEVNLPQQKPAVGQEVPVAPDLHKEKKESNTEGITSGDKKIDKAMGYKKLNEWETKPIKVTGFK